MLSEIHLPQIKKVSEKDSRGVFAIEPLYPGYGMTLGNSLRRVILSSLPGGAVTAVKIDGVSHEFSSIPKVKEDVIEIILNLKELRVKVFSDEPQYLMLDVSGKKVVKASDIKAPSTVEIVNPDLVIATLDNAQAKLGMEIRVEQGRGYVPVENREGERLEVGMIAVDAKYSPIRRVRYNVENTRVGQMTNLDKLIMDVETDGTISPQDAVNYAADLLVKQFTVLSGKELEVELEETKVDDSETQAAKILVEEINLSPRTTNALLNNDIKTISDLMKLTNEELKGLKGFGNKAYEEVKEKLEELGVSPQPAAATEEE